MSRKPVQPLGGEVEALVRVQTAELLRSNEKLLDEIARLRDKNAELARQLQEATLGGIADREGRRAALNLMEDAVRSREAEQRENAERRRVEEELRETNRRKDEFLAMLSHELRNPLAAMRAAVHLLGLEKNAGTLTPTQRQAGDIIERQLNHLARLVNDLLEVSRIVSGHVRMTMRPVDLREVVRHAVETVRPLVEQRRHALELVVPEEPVPVLCDAVRMEQVVNNLLINAAKYTKDDGLGEIRVLLETERPGGRAVLRVVDNGEGLDPDLLRDGRIFGLFVQGKRSLDRSHGGMGVGLTLVKRMVDMHEGEVEAHSRGPGTGSEFVVRVPLTPDRPLSEACGPSAPGRCRIERSHARVLIVDDNQDYAAMLGASLRAQGFGVQTVYTGADGLRAALEWRPDVVLLDIGLPEMDGYEVAKRLRAEEGGDRYTRLIAITGYGRSEDVDLAREAGFDHHLTKPIDVEELAWLIAAPMTGHPSRAPGGDAPSERTGTGGSGAPTERLRVLCVDDSPDVGTVMERMINGDPRMECVGLLSCADALSEEVGRLHPDVVLLDATMPGKDPFVAMGEVRAQFPEVKTFIFSGHDDPAFVAKAVGAGAAGCISKDKDSKEILRTLRDAAHTN
ncbi:MAG TPA: response regulator [Phycisphaerales bacterium]|nr:response regulator [Phycisphaerales bacterium]